MQTAFEATVSGRVQMVMFRAYVRDKARALGISGEVENLPDGNVRVYAEGGKDSLEKLVEFLRKGPTFSRVDNVAYQWMAPRGNVGGFFIHY